MIYYCPWCDAQISFHPDAGVTYCKECDSPVADYQAIEYEEEDDGEIGVRIFATGEW